MAHTHDSHDDHGHSEKVGHLVPPRILIATALGLLVLTVITVAVAGIDFGKYDMPELNIWVALAVAAVKGSLVALFFMHLRWDRPFNGVVFVLSMAFVALFIGFAMTDSFAYQHEIIKGDAKHVNDKMTVLKSEMEADAASHDDGAPAGH